MKKFFVAAIALFTLAACGEYYDYYQGGVKYTQDGADCIYYAGEQGRRFSSEIRELDSDNRIVYRNTRCEDLYNRDNFGALPRGERLVLDPAARNVKTCGCKSCNAKPVPVRRKYYVVTGM